MIRNFKEIQYAHKEEMERTSKLAKTLEKLKKESKNNGGKHLESITTDLCGLYCRMEQLAITIEGNESIGKDTSHTPTTLVDTIIKFAEYMPRL